MGNGKDTIKNTPPYSLYDEIARRKDWFFECQLRRLHLESFRDVEVHEQNPDPLLNLISEPLNSIPIGTRLKNPIRLYLDSKQPVWTREEREQRGAFKDITIGRGLGNWLDYKVPARLVENLARLKKLFEESEFSSSLDDMQELNNYGREDPSINTKDPKDQDKLSHAIARVAITEKQPWLIPEIFFNRGDPETPEEKAKSEIEKWIQNGETFIRNYESELNEVLGGGESPKDSFRLDDPDPNRKDLEYQKYRAWIKGMTEKLLTAKSAEAIKVEFIDQSSESWLFNIKIKTPTSPLKELKDHSSSDSVKYWINSCKNTLKEIYVNKPESDMGLCLVIRALYLYGTIPLNLGEGKELRWRKRKHPDSTFKDFFAKKKELSKDVPALLNRLDTVQRKLQILLEESADSPHSGAIHFSPLAQEIIKQDILGYKFWLDEPYHSYGYHEEDQDVKKPLGINKAKNDNGLGGDEGKKLFSEMEYWSENHYIMFASSEYLAGQLWQDENFQPARDFLKPEDKISYGILPGKQRVDESGHAVGAGGRMERGKARVLKWLNNRLLFGWTEFNSSGYYREHLWALLNLVDFALDDEVRKKAIIVTDLLLFDVTRFLHKGNMGACGGRSQFPSKNNGWDNALGDVIEIMLGTRGVFIESAGDIGCSFATSTYETPAVLLEIGDFPPEGSFIDRSRVSIDFEEASKYGIQYSQKSDQKESLEGGFAPKRKKHFEALDKVNKAIEDNHPGYGAKEDDTVFWWSLSAFYNEQIIRNTFEFRETFGLSETGIFKTSVFTFLMSLGLPILDRLSDAIVSGLVGGPFAAVGGLFINDIFGISDRESSSELLSIFLDGSTRSRANIYTFRNRDVMLSSIQNFRTGQLNYQSNVNQATISTEINVLTTSGFPGLSISNLPFALGGAAGGALGAYTLGFAAAGGAIVGGAAGVLGNELGIDGENPFGDQGDGPGWWTGYWALPMVVQHESASIIAYDFHWMQRRLTDIGSHVWFPKNAFDQFGEQRSSAYEDENFALFDIADIGPEGFWIFGKKLHTKNPQNPDADEEGYIGVFSNQRPKWQDKDSDFYSAQIEKADKKVEDFSPNDFFADKDWYVKKKNIWIIQVGNKKDYGSFDNFKERVSGAKVEVDDVGDMECVYHIPKPDGSSQALSLKYKDEIKLDGSTFQTDCYPRFENPFIRGERVEWGQREYVIEYNGKSLMHDFSNLEQPLRAENVITPPEGADIVKGLVIYLKTGDEEMEVFTVATATVNIGCKAVAVEEVIAAGKVDENTFHDAEWIFFDMSAPSNPDMTIDIGHHVIPGKDGDPDSEWKMTYTLKALMGDRSLKHCTVQPIPLGTFYLRDTYRNTGPVPFSVQRFQWRTWSMLGNTSWMKSWMIAGQPGNDFFYFDYIDVLSFDKDRILSHKKLGPCTAASPTTDLTGQDHELAVGEHYSLFPYSTRPGYLFLFLMSEGSLFVRWLFPGDSWLSRSWIKLNISYQPMIPFIGTSKPDPSSPPLPVPLGLLSRVCATFINYSTITNTLANYAETGSPGMA